ncbi:FAD-linked oxidase C-terminal domain-containing protein [Saccharopolyspora sp. S2-29]|uniref:FAD-linked oxidase C-terminal domain-containing protein n=1 Tax=Saccharopolyspora mangrovi TaxID=3082379 RepID=A0ABU6AG84_9PSEU|nr:FAD-linked oxidase C-terminal domain-containing protein [Saccharopolyspora sp. S2-29]MEB3370552.1 FAD-linked oxidase C-terminal domain-containing protein [Saccharopolyspora sp. S2-29]
MITDPTAIDRVVDRLPADIITIDPDVVATYAADQSRFTDRALPLAVAMPRTTDEVAACVRAAHEHGVVVVPRGAGSGLSGAANAPAGSIVLSLHRMTAIRELDTENRVVVVEPGVITAELRDHVRRAGLYYPPDPGSVEFCTIGGNVATNAGGMCCVKYGVTGDFVLGLECVLADGRIMRTGRRTVKGVAGFDLTSLLVGSEGALAVITEITLRLLPAPAEPRTLVASFPTLDSAGQAVRTISGAGITPSLLEILDRTTVRAVDDMTRMGLGDDTATLLLIQHDGADAPDALVGIETHCTTAGASEIVVSSDQTEADMLLEARRQALPALERLGDWLLDDVCVPCSRITDLIAAIEHIADRTGLTIGVFGHAGDGNLHPTIIYDDIDASSRDLAFEAFNAITQEALDLGGTITGEHGVGRLKAGWLRSELDPVSLAVHHSVKHAFDPTAVLNPGTGLQAHA